VPCNGMLLRMLAVRASALQGRIRNHVSVSAMTLLNAGPSATSSAPLRSATTSTSNGLAAIGSGSLAGMATDLKSPSAL
jgi:hypothetical protein